MKLFTQLNFGGNCREAFEFYERHLGGKILAMLSQGEMKQFSAGQGSGGPEDAIAHARMQLAGTELIGNDVPVELFQPMRSAYLYLAVGTAEEAERVYGLLSEGGQIFMPMGEMFFATRFAMLRDRFGVSWSVICEKRMG